MCDFVSGEILLSFPNDPEAAELFGLWFEHHGDENHLELLDRLDRRLEQVDVPESARVTSPTQLWRIGVPRGQEQFKCTWLRQHLQVALFQQANQFGMRSGELVLGTLAQPNHLLSLSSAGDGAGAVTLTDTHNNYRGVLGLDNVGPDDDEPELVDDERSTVSVALVDSGVSADLDDRVVRRVDLISPTTFGRPEEVDELEDPTLHGTAVASIIADIDDAVDLMVYRVADDEGRTSEFDVIAALLSMGDADIVNLSLAFGLSEPDCDVCGRTANSSRSLVFEETLAVLLERDHPPIVVAASGNAGTSSLSYPARFASVVAVGSVNSDLEVSDFSNRGTEDHLSEAHPAVWFLPGGDDRAGQEQAPVVVGPDETPQRGTSFACAYATGLIALALQGSSSDTVLERLRDDERGDPLHDFDPDIHGHGLLTIAALRSEA